MAIAAVLIMMAAYLWAVHASDSLEQERFNARVSSDGYGKSQREFDYENRMWASAFFGAFGLFIFTAEFIVSHA